MITILDEETSDLPHKELPFDDPGQPWIVQMAAELRDMEGKLVDSFHLHIRADGRKIRPGAEAVHGISNRQAGQQGTSEIIVLGLLCSFAGQSLIVASYGSFDRDIVAMNLMRLQKPVRMWNRPGLEFVDVKAAATAYCKLPFPPPKDGKEYPYKTGEYKWPSLEEACRIILGEEASDRAHDAADDCARCGRVFFALKDKGIIEVPEGM